MRMRRVREKKLNRSECLLGCIFWHLGFRNVDIIKESKRDWGLESKPKSVQTMKEEKGQQTTRT